MSADPDVVENWIMICSLQLEANFTKVDIAVMSIPEIIYLIAPSLDWMVLFVSKVVTMRILDKPVVNCI